jgi:hypothetical protein
VLNRDIRMSVFLPQFKVRLIAPVGPLDDAGKGAVRLFDTDGAWGDDELPREAAPSTRRPPFRATSWARRSSQST